MPPPKRGTDDAPPAVQKTYEFVLWLANKVEHFPKSHKFTIGERLTANAPSSSPQSGG